MGDKFGLLGARLGHSVSPQIHSMLGSYEYRLYEKSQDELEDFLSCGDFDGVNVTIPYKKSVIPYCAVLSGLARRIGSVNVLVRRPEGLKGFNTDYYGFLYMLSKAGVIAAGRKALVLGNGGAASTVVTALKDIGAGRIVVMSRSAGVSSGSSGLFEIDSYSNIASHYDAELIVNTTPSGMYPDNGSAPIALNGFEKCGAVLDIICNPLKTKLLLQAEGLGMKTAGGLYMLAAQAKLASQIFTGAAEDESADAGQDLQIDTIVESLVHMSENIVLIGMPGCGKTTVGKRLAKKLGRDFVDTDEEIVRRCGRSIPDIFANDGEPAFRRLEAEEIRRAACRSGLVIATGGGVVTNDENLAWLRQNGTIVFLERDLDKLEREGRPLSLSTPIEELYAQRLDRYRRWSDFSCKEEDADLSAEYIIERLEPAAVRASRL